MSLLHYITLHTHEGLLFWRPLQHLVVQVVWDTHSHELVVFFCCWVVSHNDEFRGLFELCLADRAVEHSVVGAILTNHHVLESTDSSDLFEFLGHLLDVEVVRLVGGSG